MRDIRHNHNVDPDEPLLGEAIELTDIHGEPNGMWTKVKYVLSGVRAIETYEVIDKFNRQLFVEWVSEGRHWRQCDPINLGKK